MSAVDPRWVVRHGVRYWEGGAFPEPADYELSQYTADPDALTTCGKRRGTMAGARRHYRAKEPVCAACRAGERAYRRAKTMTKKWADCMDIGNTLSPAKTGRIKGEKNGPGGAQTPNRSLTESTPEYRHPGAQMASRHHTHTLTAPATESRVA